MLIFVATIILPSLRAILSGIFILCNLFLLSTVSGQAVSPYIADSDVKNHFYKGFVHLYHFEFQSCKDEADLLLKTHPASSWGYILAAEYHWWMIVSGDESNNHGKDLIASLEAAALRSAKLSQSEGLFCKIISYTLRSRYEIFKGNYVKSLELLNQSSGLLKESAHQPDGYEPFLLTKGLYNYFIAEAGNRFWIFNPVGILGLKVDKALGIEYLTTLSNSGDEILSTEAAYFLMKIYLEVENNASGASRYSARLSGKYPTNLIFQYYNSLNGNTKSRVSPEIAMKYNLLLKQATQLSSAQRRHFEQLINDVAK